MVVRLLEMTLELEGYAVLTASDGAEGYAVARARGHNAGAEDCLAKPFNQAVLCQHVAALLSHS